MKKLYLVILFILISLSIGYANTRIEDFVKTVTKNKISEAVQKNTVSILGFGQGLSFCSGVVISESLKYTYIITCKHCTSPTEETLVENTQADAVFSPMDEDLALIIIKGKIPGKTPATLAKYNPEINDELIHIGFPTLNLYESWGKLLRTSKDWHWASIKSKAGCSGGGVYNRKKELVGILWGGLLLESISIYEPIEDINNFLNKVKEYINE